MASPPTISWNTPIGQSVASWWDANVATSGRTARLSEIHRARLAEQLREQTTAPLNRYALNLMRAGLSPNEARASVSKYAAPVMGSAWNNALSQAILNNPVPLLYPEGPYYYGYSSMYPSTYADAFEAQHPGVLSSFWQANPVKAWADYTQQYPLGLVFGLDELGGGLGLKGGAAYRVSPMPDYFSSLFTDKRLPPGVKAQLRRQAAPVSVQEVQNTPFSSLFSGNRSDEDEEYAGRTG